MAIACPRCRYLGSSQQKQNFNNACGDRKLFQESIVIKIMWLVCVRWFQYYLSNLDTTCYWFQFEKIVNDRCQCNFREFEPDLLQYLHKSNELQYECHLLFITDCYQCYSNLQPAVAESDCTGNSSLYKSSCFGRASKFTNNRDQWIWRL